MAARPSRPGMRTSISTTSGRVRRDDGDRLVAVAGLADDLDPVGARGSCANADAHQRLVVDDDDVHGRATAGSSAPTANPPSATGPTASAPAEQRRPARASRSGHGPPRRCRSGGPGRGRRPSSRTPCRRRRSTATVAAARRRVPGHVGQRLLDDPVAGQVERRRRAAGPAPRRSTVDRAARRRGSRRPGGRGRRARAAGRRRRRRRRRRAARRAGGASRRPPIGSPPRSRPGPRRWRSGERLERGAGRAGLDADQADVVGDDVVQLAGDVRALLEHRPPGPLVAIALGVGQPPLDLLDVEPPRCGPPSRAPRAGRSTASGAGAGLDDAVAVVRWRRATSSTTQRRAGGDGRSDRRPLHEPTAKRAEGQRDPGLLREQSPAASPPAATMARPNDGDEHGERPPAPPPEHAGAGRRPAATGRRASAGERDVPTSALAERPGRRGR